MTRRRAWAAAAVLMFAAIAYVVGGLVWLAGVALLAASYVILVASQ